MSTISSDYGNQASLTVSYEDGETDPRFYSTKSRPKTSDVKKSCSDLASRKKTRMGTDSTCQPVLAVSFDVSERGNDLAQSILTATVATGTGGVVGFGAGKAGQTLVLRQLEDKKIRTFEKILTLSNAHMTAQKETGRAYAAAEKAYSIGDSAGEYIQKLTRHQLAKELHTEAVIQSQEKNAILRALTIKKSIQTAQTIALPKIASAFGGVLGLGIGIAVDLALNADSKQQQEE